MSTGITSLAKLPELTAVYPFAGAEWLFTLVIVAFTLYFIVSQIRMEQGDIREELASPGAEVAIQPAE